MYIYITLGCCCHVVMVHLIKDISCIIQHCSIPQFLIIQFPLYTFPVLCNSFFCCFLFTDCGKQFIFESHSSPRCSFNPVHYFSVFDPVSCSWILSFSVSPLYLVCYREPLLPHWQAFTEAGNQARASDGLATRQWLFHLLLLSPHTNPLAQFFPNFVFHSASFPS